MNCFSFNGLGILWCNVGEQKDPHLGPPYLSLHPSSATLVIRTRKGGLKFRNSKDMVLSSKAHDSSVEASKLKSGKADISFHFK